MAGQYRALLIGNSTYPADEHNLQTLKGPVKDIAALNRALVDPGTGLFADVEVALLPEATSTRVIRALGKFFGSADRDDVLLVYFSGHGKLDQSGRLHLCMQDTESTDLLSTAVSSARIKEFADASRARNVVIVLDCCHAGAFRGADLPDAVSGPGRYVLTSCRGTQLANDATVDNGTSFFTQRLIDGLLGEAADQDGDGYVTFSDLYAYVDRQLREAGKQIPQRRVDGDGEVRLARRPPPPPADVTAATGQPHRDGGDADNGTATAHPGHPREIPADAPSSGPGVAAKGAAGPGPAAPGPAAPAPAADGHRPAPARRTLLLACAATAVVVAGGAIAIALLTGGSGGSPGSGNSGSSLSSGSTGTYTASAPWRLKVEDDGNGNGCDIVLTDAHGNQVLRHDSLYVQSVFQVQKTGSFRWRVSRQCLVAPLAASGTVTVPFAIDQSDDGDSLAFTAPARVVVRATNYHGDASCDFQLHDATDGRLLDFQTAQPGQDTVTLSPNGSRTVYLSLSSCGVHVSAG
jgi:Caspase domain